jgi:putative ABC transport system substrate-binding protein
MNEEMRAEQRAFTGTKRSRSEHTTRAPLSIYHRAALLTVLYCWMGPTASAQVALLVERGPSAYQQAAQGFQQAFGSPSEVQQIEVDESGRGPGQSLEILRRNPPRLVVAIGTRAARTAGERLPNLPILYCLTLRPVQNKLVGNNIGGIVLDVELSQQFENIRKLLPGLRRIGVVYDELTSGDLVRQARSSLGPSVQVVSRNVRTPQGAERQIRELLNNVLGPGDAFWLLWDSVTANPANFALLVELSLKNKVPILAPARPFVEGGALVAVGANYEQTGHEIAGMARQVLRGQAQPGDFAAVSPTQMTVTINAEVARQLGVTIPLDLHADILGPKGKIP